jgi:hypothetical protein
MGVLLAKVDVVDKRVKLTQEMPALAGAAVAGTRPAPASIGA